MEWPFATYIMQPLPRKIEGIAEVAGTRDGSWEVRDIWIKTGHRTYRSASYDERQQIKLTLELLAGGQIGRAYRESTQEPQHDYI